MRLKGKLFLVPVAALIGGVAASLIPGSPIDTSAYSQPATLTSDPRLQAPGSLPPLEFSIIKTGGTTSVSALLFDGGNWFEPRVSTHAAVLVKHPKGAFLFDTGLGGQVNEQFAQLPFWLRPLMAYELNGTAHDQLASEKESINEVFISHLHWDHASGIKDFPEANVWATREERAAATDPEPGLGYIRAQYDGADIKWHDLVFADQPYENFSHSLDYFGDGSVVFVPLPGHTTGSVGMFANLRSGKRYFFTSDTTWTLEGFERPADKFWFSSAIVDKDKELTRESIARVRWLMQIYPDLVIVPAHDHRVQERIGFYPVFVR